MVTETNSNREILDELRSLRKGFDEKISQDQTKKQAFDQLYSELRGYKEDFVYQTEKPLLLDLLLFYDSLNWFHESLVKQDVSPDVLEENFQYLIDELLELLYRRDVSPMESSEKFERASHRAVQVVETDIPAHHEMITQVMKRGFRRGEDTLRPEEVIVARHKGQG